jgi:hypothetical protein
MLFVNQAMQLEYLEFVVLLPIVQLEKVLIYYQLMMLLLLHHLQVFLID